MKPEAYRYEDMFGTHFTEDFSEVKYGVGIIAWTPLYAKPSSTEVAVLGKNHLGNPIPKGYYAAIRELFE